MNANWYDVLDIDPAASDDEIRSAWKAAIAELDPTDRRFRVFNQAAEVLLGADERAAYDARRAEEAAAAAEVPQQAQAEGAEGTPSPAGVPEAQPGREARPVPGWLLVALALATAVVASGAAALWWFTPSDGAVEDATSEAERAAQQASTVIFSYDHTRLEADRDAARGFMTNDQRARYEPLFDAVIKENAGGLQTKVETHFVASGTIRPGSGSDADDRVQVLVFFDSHRTDKEHTEPIIYRNFATLTMEKVDGTWLVDDIQGPPVSD